MSSTKIQLRWQPLPRVPARNHRMINSVVFGVPIKSHHRVSDVHSRTNGPSFGRFGRFGGKFVPETLMSPLRDLEEELDFVLSDHEFQAEFTTALRDYVGRETPLYFAERLTEHYRNKCRTTGDGPEIYLKREDLGHSGSHKMNNALAQAMIARRLGCSRVVAATGAGQHGVATAAACAKLSLECTVFMGTTDIEKQSSNVLSMKLLGAQKSFITNSFSEKKILLQIIFPDTIKYSSTNIKFVSSLEGTFQDASSEAIRNWVENLQTTYYLSGTVVGPHLSPVMVREFQSVIGKETRKQAKRLWGGKPDVLVAFVGSGSNALGLFHEFVGDEDVRLVGVEAAGLGLDSGKHSATLAVGDVGVYHGSIELLVAR
uniref:tryptophan synthase n=1 Tax=Brassica oleracea TaxID=3712 RepID=A0A3P6GFR5_BRAOL|nr:unnamed protein product [Brassica oleracea]